MKTKVNAGLKDWKEFAIRLLDGEVFFAKKSSDESLYVEVEQTLPDLLKIKKRLCLVWNYNRHDAAIRVVISFDPNQIYSYRVSDAAGYKYAEMLTDDEIKQYLNTAIKLDPQLYSCEFLKSLCVEKEQTLPELLKIRKRLCRAWDDDKDNAVLVVILAYEPDIKYPYRSYDVGYRHAEMLTDEEIQQEFFNEVPVKNN